MRADTPREVIERCCAELCASSAGLDAPALSPSIEGEWMLLHTSKSDFDIRAPLGARSDGSAPGLESLFPGAKQAIAASSSPIQYAPGARVLAIELPVILLHTPILHCPTQLDETPLLPISGAP